MAPQFPQVLALVSLDERDAGVVSAVRALCAAGACERVYVLHVLERGRRLGLPGGLLGAASDRPPRPEALERLVADLDAELPKIEVVGMHTVGRAVEEVARLNEREGCDLVIIGRDAAQAGSGWGEHGLRILRLADAPVLVVPHGSRLALGRALVGMDLSEDAGDALRVTAGLAREVVPLAVVDRAGEGLDDDAYGGLCRALQERYLALARDRLGRQDVPALRIDDSSSPADALLAASTEPGTDLLVIGSRGLTPLAAVLLGSTAERLGGRCAGPLLVWRTKGRQKGVFQALFRR